MARSLHRLNEQSVRSVKAAGYHADGDGLFRPMVLTTSSSKPWMKVRDADGRPLGCSIGFSGLRTKIRLARHLPREDVPGTIYWIIRLSKSTLCKARVENGGAAQSCAYALKGHRHFATCRREQAGVDAQATIRRDAGAATPV
jgi:hypothetical protein